MTTWGYVSSAMSIVLALVTLIMSVMLIVIIKGDISSTTRDNSIGLAAFGVVLSVAVMVLGIIATLKIYRADNLYHNVAESAGQGRIAVTDQSPPEPESPATDDDITWMQ